MPSAIAEPLELGIDEPLPPPPEPDTLYEVVNGQVVEPTPMGAFEVHLANVLAFHLMQFAGTLGRVEVEMLHTIDPAAGLKRRPDVSFVSFGRWPRDRRIPKTPAWEVVPDLAVEVVSPSDKAVEVQAKLHEYFRAGVRAVWIVYPDWSGVYAYTSPTAVRVLALADELDGGEVLPGFRLALTTLFEDGADPT